MFENEWEFVLPEIPDNPELIEVALDYCRSATDDMVQAIEDADMEHAKAIAHTIVLAFLDILGGGTPSAIVDTQLMTQMFLISFLKYDSVNIDEIIVLMENEFC